MNGRERESGEEGVEKKKRERRTKGNGDRVACCSRGQCDEGERGAVDGELGESRELNAVTKLTIPVTRQEVYMKSQDGPLPGTERRGILSSLI